MRRALFCGFVLAASALGLAGCSWREDLRSCQELVGLVGEALDHIEASAPPEGTQTPAWKRERADDYERLARSLEELEIPEEGLARLARAATPDFREVATALRSAARAEERADQRVYAAATRRIEAAGQKLAEWRRQVNRRCRPQ